MEFKDYVRILRAHWVGVVVLVVLGVLAAAAYNLTQPKVYEATATGYVIAGDSRRPSDASINDALAKSQGDVLRRASRRARRPRSSVIDDANP